MTRSGIYLIRNLTDGKVYVGQAANIAKRWKEHLIGLRGGYHRNRRLQRAFMRDGESNFEFSIIEKCSGPELTVREQFWMDFYDTSYRYNICPAAESSLGVKRTAETRAKLSAVKKLQKQPWLQTKESRTKAAASLKLSWHSNKPRHTEEINAKRNASLKSRWAVMPKKKPSNEVKEKMAELKRAWWAKQTPEMRIVKGEKMRAGRSQ